MNDEDRRRPIADLIDLLWMSLLCALLIVAVACLSAGVGRGAPAPLPRRKPPPPPPACVVGEWSMLWHGTTFSVTLHSEGGYQCGAWRGLWLYDAHRHCLHVEE